MRKSSEKLPEAINCVDRISSLPDTFLCHILSFLPTKQVVATSILSSRWEFLWTYVNILEFDNFTAFHPNDEVPGKMQFSQFVYGVLQHLRTPLIKTMLLRCHRRGCNEFDVATWIRTAVSCNVESLELQLNFNFKWPVRLFYSQTLVELKLAFADITHINHPSPHFFPNLKSLHLFRPKFDTDSLKTFISGCLSLEYLFFKCEFNQVETCYISSAKLKTFSFRCTLSFGVNPKVVLNTPELEFLYIEDTRKSEIFVEKSLHSLREAYIDFPCLSNLNENPNLHALVWFLECLSNVEVLRLVTDFVRPVTLALDAYFSNLTILEIAAPQFEVDLLINFMERSPYLEVITLKKTANLEKSFVIWDEPCCVPECFWHSLHTIRIQGYGNEEEVEWLIMYVLGNARDLERIEIHTSASVKNDYEVKFRMLQKITMFPRASETCQIYFF